jgi:nicotinamidase/pyrazinamidase
VPRDAKSMTEREPAGGPRSVMLFPVASKAGRARMDEHDALILVDVQVDFCPGGQLAVHEGDQVVPVLNRWIERARRVGALVIASRDWHPPNHASFREQGGQWPRHCVRDELGAEFHPELDLPDEAHVVSKGFERHRDRYSVFDEDDGLADHLRRHGVRRLWIGGLAQDFCVRDTVLDGLNRGFEVHLIADGTRPVDAEQGRQAIAEMRAAGAIIETAADGEPDD